MPGKRRWNHLIDCALKWKLALAASINQWARLYKVERILISFELSPWFFISLPSWLRNHSCRPIGSEYELVELRVKIAYICVVVIKYNLHLSFLSPFRFFSPSPHTLISPGRKSKDPMKVILSTLVPTINICESTSCKSWPSGYTLHPVLSTVGHVS